MMIYTNHICNKWISAYIFPKPIITEGKQNWRHAFDRLIIDVIRPFVLQARKTKLIDRFFFIRYGEFGPHIRLRMEGVPDVLTERVRPSFVATVADALGDPPDGVPSPSIFKVGTSSGAPALYWVPYEPELHRYGGPDGIRLAERFFNASSLLVFDFLDVEGGLSYEMRLARGAVAMVILLGSFSNSGEEGIEWARLHRLQWSPSSQVGGDSPWVNYEERFDQQAGHLQETLRNFWTGAIEGSLPPPFAAYTDELRRARSAIDKLVYDGRFASGRGPFANPVQAAAYLAPSYLHMTNNRLGVSANDEGYLAHLVLRSLTS